MENVMQHETTPNDNQLALPEPKFGEWLRGIYASESNPHRDGMYVRTIRRTGRLNPGVHYEVTDGNGLFWQYPAQSVERLDRQVAAALRMGGYREGTEAEAAHSAAEGVSEDAEEDAYVIRRTCELLAHIAVIVNGPEPPLTRWSYHDLPEKVAALKGGAQ